ncbi:MAG: hypothetical protein E7589_05820 [Ruminococcaceae bacterium]|nr:hypothetical protein [Oscillospiraceae bacterium]
MRACCQAGRILQCCQALSRMMTYWRTNICAQAPARV